jgi:beta-aspartyl-peptidase (threonine type)
VGGEAGGIAIDREGRIGFAHSSSHFAVAWMTEEMNAPSVCLRRDEEGE